MLVFLGSFDLRCQLVDLLAVLEGLHSLVEYLFLEIIKFFLALCLQNRILVEEVIEQGGDGFEVTHVLAFFNVQLGLVF